jgi:Na+-driven multidrug efflux pump
LPIRTIDHVWSSLFTSDPQVIAASVSYITRVAPLYCLFGLGLTLNFASQGAGRMTAPLVAGVVRMAAATTGGWLAVEQMGLGLDGVFAAICRSVTSTICRPVSAIQSAGTTRVSCLDHFREIQR